MLSSLFPFFFMFCSALEKKKHKNQKTTTKNSTQNRSEAPEQLPEHFKFPCVYYLVTACCYILSAEPISISFPRVTLLLCHEAACQSQCFMSIFPSQLDSRTVMESIFHHSGSSFSFLSAAQPRAAKVHQASLVTWIQPSLRKRPLSF